MAIDPNMSDEQKKRQRLRNKTPLFDAATMAGAAGAPAPRVYSGELVPRVTVGDVRQLAVDDAAPRAQVASGRGLSAYRAAQTTANQLYDQQLDQQGVDVIRKGRGARGETVYSNIPNDGLISGPAETQYYGADGQRIGQGLRRPDLAQVQPGGAVDAAAQSREFYESLEAQNRPQLAAIGNRQAEIKRRGDPDLAWVDDPRQPSGRGVMTRAERVAAGLEKPGTAGGADVGDMINLMKFQQDQREFAATQEDRALTREDRQRGLRRQERADLIERYREDPQGTFAEELAGLRGASPEEAEAYFETEAGKLLLKNFDRQFKQRTGADAHTFGGLGARSDANLGDLTTAPAIRQPLFGLGGRPNRVVQGDELFGGIITPEAFGPDVDEDTFQLLMDYYARENAERRRPSGR